MALQSVLMVTHVADFLLVSMAVVPYQMQSVVVMESTVVHQDILVMYLQELAQEEILLCYGLKSHLPLLCKCKV